VQHFNLLLLFSLCLIQSGDVVGQQTSQGCVGHSANYLENKDADKFGHAVSKAAIAYRSDCHDHELKRSSVDGPEVRLVSRCLHNPIRAVVKFA